MGYFQLLDRQIGGNKAYLVSKRFFGTSSTNPFVFNSKFYFLDYIFVWVIGKKGLPSPVILSNLDLSPRLIEQYSKFSLNGKK